MKIVLLGPPGVGKGTQANELSKQYNIPHISTGDILRDNISRGTELGVLAKKIIDDGNYMSDEIILNMVKSRLLQDDAKNGYIFDGFPRTLAQAKELQSWDVKPNIIIDYNVSNTETLITRMLGRMVDKKSGRVYHKYFNPPTNEGLDNFTGDKLVSRADDNYETCIKRISIFDNETSCLRGYYQDLKNKNKGTNFISVNSDNDINTVFGTAISFIESLKLSKTIDNQKELY